MSNASNTTTPVAGVATRVQFQKPHRNRYGYVARSSTCGDYTIKTMRGTHGSYYAVYYRSLRLGTEWSLACARDAVDLHAESIRPA